MEKWNIFTWNAVNKFLQNYGYWSGNVKQLFKCVRNVTSVTAVIKYHIEIFRTYWDLTWSYCLLIYDRICSLPSQILFDLDGLKITSVPQISPQCAITKISITFQNNNFGFMLQTKNLILPILFIDFITIWKTNFTLSGKIIKNLIKKVLQW